jgi:hypothetical protein
MTFIEQSVKLAARAYVFEPNDANTWSAVKSMICSFLTRVWKEGGLQGASAADAFQVDVGLGSTMTADDLLNGFMRVSIMVAVVHPAEFIVITFEQQAQSGKKICLVKKFLQDILLLNSNNWGQSKIKRPLLACAVIRRCNPPIVSGSQT